MAELRGTVHFFFFSRRGVGTLEVEFQEEGRDHVTAARGWNGAEMKRSVPFLVDVLVRAQRLGEERGFVLPRSGPTAEAESTRDITNEEAGRFFYWFRSCLASAMRGSRRETDRSHTIYVD